MSLQRAKKNQVSEIKKETPSINNNTFGSEFKQVQSNFRK